MIGPFRGGRVVAVTGVPGDETTFYFGSVGGGIWKTIDAGVTWTPIFDGQPIASIGALEVAPSDPNVLYAGTGESDIRSDLSSGDGVYKSTDGGATWKNVGLRDSRQISRIVIDPTNADVVYVGVLGHAYGPNDERGVYKSTDGGKHLDARAGQRAGDRRFRSGHCGRFSRTFCSPAPGTRIVRRGAPTLRCKGRAADFIARPTAARPGRSSPGMDCPMAIGAASAWPSRPTASASTR